MISDKITMIRRFDDQIIELSTSIDNLPHYLRDYGSISIHANRLNPSLGDQLFINGGLFGEILGNGDKYSKNPSDYDVIDYRQPMKGEYYMSTNGGVVMLCHKNEGEFKRNILIRKERK